MCHGRAPTVPYRAGGERTPDHTLNSFEGRPAHTSMHAYIKQLVICLLYFIIFSTFPWRACNRWDLLWSIGYGLYSQPALPDDQTNLYLIRHFLPFYNFARSWGATSQGFAFFVVRLLLKSMHSGSFLQVGNSFLVRQVLLESLTFSVTRQR